MFTNTTPRVVCAMLGGMPGRDDPQQPVESDKRQCTAGSWERLGVLWLQWQMICRGRMDLYLDDDRRMVSLLAFKAVFFL